jgi:hypothetical protein
MSNEITPEIDSADICERLVGITPIYLQNFVARGLYGLRASVKPGKVRAQRRLFSRDDVFGIALIWLLFEAGMRTDPIIRIVKDITGTDNPNPNLAAKKLLQQNVEYLVIDRTPRLPTKTPSEKPGQKIHFLREAEEFQPGLWNPAAAEILLPVGQKFRDIETRLRILFPPKGA